MSDLQGLISIARKAGFVVVGQDNLIGYNKKLYLLLMDKSAGGSLSREMTHLCNIKNIPLYILENLEQLTKISNCKVVGIKNKDFSVQMERIIKGE